MRRAAKAAEERAAKDAEKQAMRLSVYHEAGDDGARGAVEESRRLMDVEATEKRAAEMKVTKQLASDRAKAAKRAHRAKEKAIAAAQAAREAERRAVASADIEQEWIASTPGVQEVEA
jgi:hypothetical protein